MTVPVIPSPALMSVADVDRYASQVEEFVAGTESLAEARDAGARWAAVATWVRKTSRDGVRRAEEAQRRIERRIGELIQAEREAGRLAERGYRSDLAEPFARLQQVADIGISGRDAAEFVAMAEHADVLDRVISESTDDEPPTRNKVRTAIREAKQVGDTDQRDTDQRVATIREMAASGFTSDQIAERVGHGVQWTKKLASQNGITIQADEVMRKRKRINPHAVIENIVTNISGTEHTLELVWDSIESLDTEKRLTLLEELRQPLSALNRLKKELAK